MDAIIIEIIEQNREVVRWRNIERIVVGIGELGRLSQCCSSGLQRWKRGPEEMSVMFGGTGRRKYVQMLSGLHNSEDRVGVRRGGDLVIRQYYY